jgi:hypothetical protein
VSAALVLIGAALIVAGTSIAYWPAGLIVAGVLFLFAGVDLRGDTA